MKLPTQDEQREAIRRLSRTPDGLMLYRFLQIELMSVERANDVGALYRNEGRRSLALELKRLMDEELVKAEPPSAGRTGVHDADEPLIDAGRAAVDANRQRGVQRRRTGWEPEPGAD